MFSNDDKSHEEIEPSLVIGLKPPRWYGRSIWAVTLCSLGLIFVMGFLSARGMYGRLALVGAALGVFVLLAASGDRLMRPTTVTWLIRLVALAMLVRLACVMLIPYLPCADFKVYHDSGVTMAKTWTLGVQAAAGQSGSYRCFFPPGQVFSMGVMYRLFGPHVLAVQILNVIYSTLTVVGIWYLGRKMFSERVGRISAVLVALLPSAVFGCMLLGAEVPEAFWLVLAMCFYVTAVEREHRLVPALLCGICLGIGALIRPTYFLLPVPIGLHMLLSWGRARRAILSAAVMSAGLAAVVLPWTYRNYRATGGGFILVSSNAGGVLYSANNDKAQGAYTQEAWEYVFENSPDDLTLMRVGKQRALSWIKANPGRFAQLALWKFVLFWHTDKEIAWWAVQQTHEEHPQLGIPEKWRMHAQAGSTGYYVIIVLAGALGVWRRRRQLRKNRAWMVIPVMCMYFTAVHMVFESQGKYHYMLVPLLCILAAMVVDKRASLFSILDFGFWISRKNYREGAGPNRKSKIENQKSLPAGGADSPLLSIVIPAHNEESRLPGTLEEVFAFLSVQPYSAEVLVVENGSEDRTFEVAQLFGKSVAANTAATAPGHPSLRVFRENRRGKGLAVRRGMLEAEGQFRFLCDADLSMPIAEVNRFLPPLLEDFDIAIGSREAPGAIVDQPASRRRIGRIFNAIVRLLALPGLRDTQCGFKCFRAAVAEDVFSRQRLDGMAFDVEVLRIARHRGYRIIEVPITWNFDPDSRVRLFRDSFRMVLELLTIRRNARRGLYDD